ncbi:MAG: hypothetical protein ACRELV_07195 [Longimicrobiales bacterium]
MPYDLAFARGDVEAHVFPEIRAEAEARGVDATDPERFAQLGTVGAEIRELLSGEAAGALVEQAATLYYHGFHAWLVGNPVRRLDEPRLRRLLDCAGSPGGEDAPRGPSARSGSSVSDAPEAAGYAQFPANLLWARTDPESTPEPVDGFFWVLRSGAIALLFVLGVRAGRPGFSVIPVRAEVPEGGIERWAEGSARPDGDDFANVLPGGELGGLYAMTTPAEALKLAALVLAYGPR